MTAHPTAETRDEFADFLGGIVSVLLEAGHFDSLPRIFPGQCFGRVIARNKVVQPNIPHPEIGISFPRRLD